MIGYPYRCQDCNGFVTHSEVRFVETETYCVECYNAHAFFTYRISFDNGYGWDLTTDEDPMVVCERIGMGDRVIDIKTLELVGA